MKDFAAKTATNMATNHLKKKVTQQFQSKEGIDWTDLNYPPGLKLLHYDIKEVEAPKKLLMHLIHGYFCLQSILFVLNFINAIIQVASGYSWTRLIASVFYYFIVILLCGFIFYSAFQSFVGVPAGKMMFYISMGVLLFMFIFQLIFDTLSWNGLARVIHIFQDGYVFAGLISLLEFFIILGQACFAIYLVVAFVRAGRNDGESKPEIGDKKKTTSDSGDKKKELPQKEANKKKEDKTNKA